MQPNLREFLAHIAEYSPELTLLTCYQRELAKSLIAYRVDHQAGGCRSGRTTVVNAVQDYFSVVYPSQAKAGKEI